MNGHEKDAHNIGVDITPQTDILEKGGQVRIIERNKKQTQTQHKQTNSNTNKQTNINTHTHTHKHKHFEIGRI